MRMTLLDEVLAALIMAAITLSLVVLMLQCDALP